MVLMFIFLNRGSQCLRVRNSSELETIFAFGARRVNINLNYSSIISVCIGSTPIVPVLRQVLKDKRNQIYERNLLILLATDGIPTDEKERTDIHTLEHVL